MGELGVDEREARQHGGAAQADFDAMSRGGEDGVAGHFGAGARCSGDRNTGCGGVRKRLSAADHFEVVEKIAGIGEEGGDGFGGVERGAAAEADNEVTPGGTGSREAAERIVGGGFVRDREGRGANARRREEIEERRGAAGIATRYDESVVAELPRGGRGFTERSGAEEDAGGKGEVEAHEARRRGDGEKRGRKDEELRRDAAATSSSEVGVGREEVGEFHAGARFGHHRRDGVAPGGVVGGGLVGGRRVGCAVGFDEDEAGGIVGLLQDIEACDTGLADAGAGVGERRGLESCDVFGFHVNVDMNKEHDGSSVKGAGQCGKSRRECKPLSLAVTEAEDNRSNVVVTTPPVNLPMKTRLLTALAVLCCATGALFAQAPKKDDKKAPAPKSASEAAFDEFQKVRNKPGAKADQARFQEVIAAGAKFLAAHPATGRANEVINFVGVQYPMSIDAKQPALREQYVSLVNLEIANQKYKDGVTDPVRAAFIALEAAVADFDVRRTSGGREQVATLREKIDALAEAPGGGRFLTDRERSYVHLLYLMNQLPRAEEQLKKLATHKEKGVADMAKQEMSFLELRRKPIDVKFTALDGKQVDLAALRGKAVGVYFFNSTNKGHTDQLDKLRQFASDFRKKGFELVTVSLDKEEDRPKLEKYVKEVKLAQPVYFDGKQGKGELPTKLNVTSAPRLLLFTPEGTIAATIPPGSTLLSTDYRNMLGAFEAEVKKGLKIK